jgi:hypothetical protein
MCQKASGQPFMAFARVARDKFEWTRGDPGAFRSSNLVEPHFCGSCGTPLTYSEVDEPQIWVTGCSLDNPEAAAPEMQYSVDTQVSWFAKLHELPSKRTDEFISPDRAARTVSYQHPDHDT